MPRFFAGRSGSAAALSAAQLLCASAELGVVAPALAGLPTWPAGPAVVALLALGALGTGWAYVLNLGVVRAAGPTVASTVTYVIPVWSTLIGAVLLAERSVEHRRRPCAGGRRGRRHPPSRARVTVTLR
jgi:drug/metabolite transporter (DMT)-like permease